MTTAGTAGDSGPQPSGTLSAVGTAGKATEPPATPGDVSTSAFIPSPLVVTFLSPFPAPFVTSLSAPTTCIRSGGPCGLAPYFEIGAPQTSPTPSDGITPTFSSSSLSVASISAPTAPAPIRGPSSIAPSIAYFEIGAPQTPPTGGVVKVQVYSSLYQSFPSLALTSYLSDALFPGAPSPLPFKGGDSPSRLRPGAAIWSPSLRWLSAPPTHGPPTTGGNSTFSEDVHSDVSNLYSVTSSRDSLHSDLTFSKDSSVVVQPSEDHISTFSKDSPGSGSRSYATATPGSSLSARKSISKFPPSTRSILPGVDSPNIQACDSSCSGDLSHSNMDFQKDVSDLDSATLSCDSSRSGDLSHSNSTFSKDFQKDVSNLDSAPSRKLHVAPRALSADAAEWSMLPEGYRLQHNFLAKDLRAMLADEARSPSTPSLARVRGWNDLDLIQQLEACDRHGGFVLNHDGLNDVVHDERRPDGSRPLPRLSPEQWQAAHRNWGKELRAGFADRVESDSELCAQYPIHRFSRWNLAPKKSLGRQVVDPDTGALKWRTTWNGSDGRYGIGGEWVGDSLNDRAPIPEPSSTGWDGLWFDGVDFAAEEIVRLKRAFGGCEVSKVDQEQAYRSLALAVSSRRHFCTWILNPDFPVPEYVLAGEQPRPEDCIIVVLNRFPFGTCHSVQIYHRLSRALNALFLWSGHPNLLEHSVPEEKLSAAVYVDDNLPMSAPGFGAAAKARLLAMFARYGIRASEAKDIAEGEVTDISKVFLGVLLGIEDETLRVPPERVEDGMLRIREMLQRRVVLRKEFESLVGILNHAARCLGTYARLFLRRCWLALAFTHGRWLRNSRGVKVDLQWWLAHFEESNGVSMMVGDQWRNAKVIDFWTDASGGVGGGFGAVFRLPDGTLEWFGGAWADYCIDPTLYHISELELLVYVLACNRWEQWLSGKIMGHCDNLSCCQVLASCRTSDPGFLVCLRKLFASQARGGFELRARWISTKDNVASDAISRGDLPRFFEFARTDLGVELNDIHRIEPSLDVADMLHRILQAKRHHTNLVKNRGKTSGAKRGRRHRR